jgi:hypothetical protein
MKIELNTVYLGSNNGYFIFINRFNKGYYGIEIVINSYSSYSDIHIMLKLFHDDLGFIKNFSMLPLNSKQKGKLIKEIFINPVRVTCGDISKSIKLSDFNWSTMLKND